MKLAAPDTLISVGFPDNELPFGEEVVIEVRSSDGSTIAVDAKIAGTECPD